MGQPSQSVGFVRKLEGKCLLEWKLHVSISSRLAVSIFWKLSVEKQQSEMKSRKSKVGIDDYSPFRVGYMMPKIDRASDIPGR